jgi:hypothetical protein
VAALPNHLTEAERQWQSWVAVVAVRTAIVRALHAGDVAAAQALLPAESRAVAEWRDAVAEWRDAVAP